MIKTTRRHLDTCACVIEYSWEDDGTPGNVEILNKKTINKCAQHVHFDNGESHLNQIFSEDQERLVSLQNG